MTQIMFRTFRITSTEYKRYSPIDLPSELHKSVSAFDDDITDAAVGLEELFNVALAHRRGQVANVHTRFPRTGTMCDRS